MKACVVVLGDVGRSPRINFHALSLAKHGCNVTLMGYKASKMHPLLASNQLIQSRGIPPPPDFFKYLPRALSLALKIVWLYTFLLFGLLFAVGFPNLIILQNPPGIPSMAVCWLVAKMKRSRFIIDWHNYTYSILNLELSNASDKRHPAVNFAESWEKFWGQKADLSLCVTHAMRDDLLKRWGVRAVTLYDRPPQGIFRVLSIEEKHNFFLKLAADKMYEPFWSLHSSENEHLQGNPEVTRFSYRDDSGIARLRDDRPLLLVSSTSWTFDEDFSILLTALQKYDRIAKESDHSDKKRVLPPIVAVITGKGPLKEFYLEEIEQKKFEKVEVITPWLEAEDYPKILACADLGVSLHTSSSGLDLPMKVVDMFGCCLPVLAKRFKCIEELVKEGEFGYLFDNDLELCDWLMRMSLGFPSNSSDLGELKQNLLDSPLVSWEENWDSTVWPLLQIK